jgi:hypothetical protein
MVFLTPTNKEIDLDALQRAMLDRNFATSYALDIETGEVEFISDFMDTIEDQEKASDRWDATPQRYFAPPRIGGDEQYRWREDFIREIVIVEDTRLSERLRRSIKGAHAFRRFHQALKDAGEEWLVGWRQWEADSAFEEIQLWLAAVPVDITQDLPLSEDCDMCKDFARSETHFQKHQRTQREAQDLLSEDKG